MAGTHRRHLGRVFDEVPELYDRVRPTYPDELFADLVAVTGMDERSSVLEVGCGTGQATRSLAALGCSVTAVEPGTVMAALARRRLAPARTSTSRRRRSRSGTTAVGASTSLWLHPRGTGSTRPSLASSARRAPFRRMDGAARQRRRPPPGRTRGVRRDCRSPRALLSRKPHWGHPPLENEVRATNEGWGLVEDPGSLFGPTIVRWYPTVQRFDGEGFADLLRSTSLYRSLDRDVSEPLLDAIAERIRTRMEDRASRRYLSVLRVGERVD